jgi:hypothetical protein
MRVKIIFTSLLLLNVFWYIVYEFVSPDFLYDEFNRVIGHDDTILNNMKSMYSSGIPSLIIIPISFASIIYALIILWGAYAVKPRDKKYLYAMKPRNKKLLLSNLIFAIFSLSMLFINCTIFWERFFNIRV